MNSANYTFKNNFPAECQVWFAIMMGLIRHGVTVEQAAILAERYKEEMWHRLLSPTAEALRSAEAMVADSRRKTTGGRIVCHECGHSTSVSRYSCRRCKTPIG